MRRRVAVLGAAVGLVAVSGLAAVEHPAASLFGYAFWGLFLVGTLVQAVLGRRRGDSVGQVLAPGLRGLDEVQGLYLGRPTLPPPGYRPPEGVTTELVEPRTNPLDDAVWFVPPPTTSGPATGARDATDVPGRADVSRPR